MTTVAPEEGKATILLVEDEAGPRATICMLLDLEGYTVTTASDGREGLAALDTRTPDLIITDYAMPYMDGLEMIQAIRSNPERYGQCLILLMSTYLPLDASKADLADSFIAKPITMDRLLLIVELLLSHRPDG